MDAEVFAREATGVQQQVTRVVYLVAGDLGLAEECAQEAMIRAWSQAQAGRMPDSVRAWCTTVGLNHCRSQLRRRGAEQRALHRLGPPRVTAPATPDPLSDEVRHAVLALPVRQREVVVLHYLLDLDVAAIASTAEITPGAVRNALFHARKALSRSLTPDDRDPAATPTGASPAEEPT